MPQVPLHRIAAARSGDKGEGSNVGVVARSDAAYAFLTEHLTAERVRAHMADPAARTSVEVEGLEPGMRYTWRLVIETADGREISETVTCEAPVCPADMQGEAVP